MANKGAIKLFACLLDPHHISAQKRVNMIQTQVRLHNERRLSAAVVIAEGCITWGWGDCDENFIVELYFSFLNEDMEME